MRIMVWSIKESRRQTSILTANYDVPFAAIALIFLMSFSPGSGWQQNKKSRESQNDSSHHMKLGSADGLPSMKFDMQTHFIPNKSFNYTSSTHRILKDNNYNYREEKVRGTNYTHSLTTKLFPLHDGLKDDPIINIRTPARLYEKSS